MNQLTRHAFLLTIVTIILGNTLAIVSDSRADETNAPNIIFIMADDLGYGDLGCYGQKLIETPELDKMAKEGIRFRNFYAGNTVCAPSRCVLMTGKHMGHAYVRGNGGVDVQGLRDRDVTVAEVLKNQGYKTALCGKWGLGESTRDNPNHEGVPNQQGFDFFYGYQSQLHAHNYYPAFLWKNDERIALRNEVVPAGRKDLNGFFKPGYATKRLDYSHDLIQNEALSFIKRNRRNPFFLYLALTIPHANNEGTRGTGDGQEVPDYGIYSDKPWSNQDKGQAAMVTRMDKGIGEIVSLLAELGVSDNTIIMFTSDNGHHDEGGHNTELFDPNGPLRGKKRDLYEGGIRVPMIVKWPGKIKPGSITDHVSYFGDLMATVAELTGAPLPAGLDSISFLPTLLGKRGQRNHDYLYWEFYEQGGKQAVRSANWKAVRIPMFSGNVELYNLDNDLGESEDLAQDHPGVVQRLKQLMDSAHQPNPNWQARGKAPNKRPAAGDGKPRF